MVLKNLERLFFEKIRFIFFTFVILLKKNLTIKVERIIEKSNIIWYAFYSNYTAFTYCQKNDVFFSKKKTTFGYQKFWGQIESIELLNI